jgi:hypothetical protein
MRGRVEMNHCTGTNAKPLRSDHRREAERDLPFFFERYRKLQSFPLEVSSPASGLKEFRVGARDHLRPLPSEPPPEAQLVSEETCPALSNPPHARERVRLANQKPHTLANVDGRPWPQGFPSLCLEKAAALPDRQISKSAICKSQL